MSDRDLKPCPFCGGEAEINRFVRRGYSYIVPQVVCKNCLAMMGREREIVISDRGRLNFINENEAIEAWNRRAESEE